MNTQNILSSVIVSAIMVVLGFAIFGGKTVVEKQIPVGATAGTDHYFNETFYDDITLGGMVFATSSTGTVTYTAASLAKAALIEHTAASNLTANLPASSTIYWIPRAGDRKNIRFAAITSQITLAGGIGTDLNSASSTKVILPGTIGNLEFVRKSNSDIEVLMTTAAVQ
jgi:hypothetical protein